jgi:hypothetical protein
MNTARNSIDVNRTQALVELGRFFEVASIFHSATGKSANMPACMIDQTWHELMTDPSAYQAFTEKAVGVSVEHMENKGEGLIEWVNTYREKFGILPALWFTAPSGAFNSELYDVYQGTGVLEMSWDCSPRFPKVDPPKKH